MVRYVPVSGLFTSLGGRTIVHSVVLRRISSSMDKLCDEYDDTELELLADFLRRTTDAGRRATDELAGD